MSASSPKEYGSSINPVNLPKGTGNPHTIESPTQGQPWGSNNYEVPNTNQRGGSRQSPSLGDLGRNYNFGNTYTNLSYERDPFIHLLTKFKKKPTDDFKFEYAIKRDLATFKRYGYVVGLDANGTSAPTSKTGSSAANAGAAYTEEVASGQTIVDYKLAVDDGDGDEGDANNFEDIAVDGTFCVLVAGDYKTHGNISNKIGNTSANVALGDPFTKPNWFLVNQVIRIPVTDAIGGAAKDYVMARILETGDYSIKSSATGTPILFEAKWLKCKLIKAPSSSNGFPAGGCATATTLMSVDPGDGPSDSVAQFLEPRRAYISGTAYHELSGYGDTWKQQPFTTDFGQTQIFKKTAMMSGRAMATKLKFGENPWANEWKDKMSEMTWEIGQAGYFGEQYTDSDGITYTEGIVNFILNNGNSFSWSQNHTIDDYLEQLSALHDPRQMVGGKQSHVYYCNTQVYNWHAKLGGFMKNNAEISPNYSVQYSGAGKMAGVSYRTFDVDGKTIKLVRDIHLDQTHVKMICANMSACAIRPLIGNGINRDVTVYPGVKTVKNSGEDYRVDLIQADLGFEFSAPETHAVWL